jgi:hypothetical protein
MAFAGDSLNIEWVDAVEDIAIDLDLPERNVPRQLDLE